MSADDGIYILQTPKGESPSGSEFRVAHLQAIENLWWDHGQYRDGNDAVAIKNAREMFDGCEVFTDKGAALLKADAMASECDILEYGISTIQIAEVF